jgi:hypothetical protein
MPRQADVAGTVGASDREVGAMAQGGTEAFAGVLTGAEGCFQVAHRTRRSVARSMKGRRGVARLQTGHDRRACTWQIGLRRNRLEADGVGERARYTEALSQTVHCQRMVSVR